MTGPFSFGACRSDDDGGQVERIKEWATVAFDLDEDAFVMVTELRCTEPGCPPLETAIAVLGGDGQRRLFKVFKPIAEVTVDDVAALPFAGQRIHRQ